MQKRSKARVGRIPLLAFDHPFIAFARRLAGELFWIRTGLRLRHREARNDFAVEQRLQVALLLLRRAEQRQDFGIAGIGRGATEHRRRPRRAADDFVHERELELPVTFAAELRRQMTRPQPLSLHFVAQRLDRRARFLVLRVVHRARVRKQQIERLDLFAHERVHPIELLLEFGIDSEVHDIGLGVRED